jgi:hypothetical protein
MDRGVQVMKSFAFFAVMARNAAVDFSASRPRPSPACHSFICHRVELLV